MKNKTDLEDVVKAVQPSRQCNVCGIDYTKDYDLTICSYRSHAFIGLCNPSGSPVTFCDNDSQLQVFQRDMSDILLCRVENMNRQSAPSPLFAKNIEQWKPAYPLLDAYILYEAYTDQFAHDNFSNGKFDAGVNALVEAYEATRDTAPTTDNLYLAVNGMVPSLDKAWKLYTDPLPEERRQSELLAIKVRPGLLHARTMFLIDYPQFKERDCRVTTVIAGGKEMFYLTAPPPGLPKGEPEIIAIFDNGRDGCRFVKPQDMKLEVSADIIALKQIELGITQESTCLTHDEYEEPGPER